MAGKRNVQRDNDARKAWALSRLDQGCMSCGMAFVDWRGLSVHHLFPGRCGRSDEPANYLLVCGPCHDVLEGRRVIVNRLALPLLAEARLGVGLTMKLVRNYEDWDRDACARLSGPRMPELEPIPSWIEDRYRQAKPVPYRPFTEEHLPLLEAVNLWIQTYEVTR
jgi:hypothetical protein